MAAPASPAVLLLSLVLLLALALSATAFVPASHAAAARRGASSVRMGLESGSGDRREAIGRLLLGGATAAAGLGLGSLAAPPPATAAAAAVAPAAAAGGKPKKVPLPPYPAKVTDKVYLDVRITGFVTGEEKATNEEFKGRIVVGLFGEDAPLAAKQFLEYASAQYGGEAPSYAFSSFLRTEPGESVTAGRIKGLKEIQLAGSRQFEWFDRAIGAKGLDEPKEKLRHDRKGLLTKNREQDAVDPVFDITLGPTPERDGRATVFGMVLEGFDALDEVAAVPVYTMEAAGPQPEGLDKVFVEQKKLFLNVAKTFGDERAVDRRGSFLKRVEIVGCGVV